jgi:hypothetical protein
MNGDKYSISTSLSGHVGWIIPKLEENEKV